MSNRSKALSGNAVRACSPDRWPPTTRRRRRPSRHARSVPIDDGCIYRAKNGPPIHPKNGPPDLSGMWINGTQPAGQPGCARLPTGHAPFNAQAALFYAIARRWTSRIHGCATKCISLQSISLRTQQNNDFAEDFCCADRGVLHDTLNKFVHQSIFVNITRKAAAI